MKRTHRLLTGHLFLELPSKVAIHGAQLGVLDDHLARSGLGVQSSVSWDVLIGAADVARVSPDGLRAAVRRWFSWEETLGFTTHELHRDEITLCCSGLRLRPPHA